MKKIREYIKTKKGMTTIAVITFLIIAGVALVFILGKSENKDDLKGNTVENMDDAELTVSDDPEGPKEEDGSTDFSEFLEEGADTSSDDQKDDDQKDDDQKDDGQKDDDQKDDDQKDDDQKDDDLEDGKDQIPGGQYGPLY